MMGMQRMFHALSLGTGLFRIVRMMLVLVLSLRAVAWALGWVTLSTPIDVIHLESKMVYVAQRAELGRELYPNWQQFPYEGNFFGPIYFVVVGLLGRLAGCDDDGLRLIGRIVTGLSVAAIVRVVYLVVRRETGDRTASAIAGLAILTSVPMLDFGQCVRPDMLAAALSLTGYWLWTSHQSKCLAISFLCLAVLTKQTAVSAGVAIIVWAGIHRLWREAITAAVGWLVAVVAAVGLLTVVWEPRLAVDLLGEGGTPFDWDNGCRVLLNAVKLMPDLLLALLVFLGWRLLGGSACRVACLALTALLWNSVSCFKEGAWLNYFVESAIAASMASGLLWSRTGVAVSGGSINNSHERGRGWWFWPSLVGAVIGLSCAASQPLMYAVATVIARWNTAAFFRSAHPKALELDRLIQLVRSDKLKVLSDSSFLALKSLHEPPFVDPWLFRNLVVNRRLYPTELLRRLESREYDLVVTTSEVMDPGYDNYVFGFPPVVAEVVRRQYRFVGIGGGMFLYEQR